MAQEGDLKSGIILRIVVLISFINNIILKPAMVRVTSDEVEFLCVVLFIAKQLSLVLLCLAVVTLMLMEMRNPDDAKGSS